MPSISFKLKVKLPNPSTFAKLFRLKVGKAFSSVTKEQQKAYQNEVKDISESKRPILTVDTKENATSIISDIKVTERVGKLQLWKWRFVTGTRPHIIRARNVKFLRFQLNYSAKMRGGSGTSSGPFRYAKEVHHPGYRPVNVLGYINTRFNVKRTEILKKIGEQVMNKW